MWRTLTSFAETEMETTSEAAKQSYEKLAIATWELQKHVKELLCDYPGAVAEEPAIMSAEEPTGKDGEAMGHAARLLGSLCAQPARSDVTGAPGAIYTPKGDVRGRNPTDAGPSVLEGAGALKVFLSADLPSMRWAAAAGPGVEAGVRQRQLHTAPGRGALDGQRATPKLLRVRLDTTMELDAQTTLQKQSDELLTWALASLRSLHPDASLENVHGALLLGALQSGALPPRGGATWFRTYGDNGIVARSRQLLAGVFHASRSSQEAWAALTAAFSHGLVQPDGEAARLLGRQTEEVMGTPAFDVTPESYQTYIKDMQDKMDELVREQLRGGFEDGDSLRAGRSLSEKDAAACRLSITPRSYLQVVGQKLLHHAAHQVPCMAELPEHVPDWTLRYLYGRPFAEAVRLALQHGMASINDVLGPGGEGPDQRVRGSKLAQSLLQSSAGHKDVNPKKAEPRQSRQAGRERADSAGPRISSSGGGLFGQRASADVQMGVDSGGGGGAAPTAAVKVDACERAMSRARSAVGLLADIQRDIEGFEDGLAEIFCSDAHDPLRPMKSEDGAQQPRALVQPGRAAAYISVIREEIGRTFREMAPTLRTFLYDSVTFAVLACLSRDDLQQPPRPLPVSADLWPSLEALPREARKNRAAPPPSLSHSGSRSSSPRGDGAAATAQACGDGSAFVWSGAKVAGVGPEADRSAPPAVDAVSHRVLELVAWLCDQRGQLPEPLQPVLFGAVLECLALLMDRLSLVCAALGDIPGDGGSCGGCATGGGPLPLAFLFHSAGCCARRRLEALQPVEVLGSAAATAVRQPHDVQQEVDLARQHGEALVQADELVTSIHQHIVLAYMQIMYDVVFSSVDRTDWCAFRPDVMRGQTAGPAVRVWHSMLLRLLHTATLHASPHAAEWIVGQVLLESAGCLVRRYLQLCPTVQMLQEFVADAVHLTASAFLLAQPIAVGACLRGGSGGYQRAGQVAGQGTSQRQQQQRQDSATEAAKQDVLWLRVPFPVARALAEAARELLIRAALLHVPGSQLEELARKAGLLAAAAGAGEPEQAAEETPPAGGIAAGGSGSGTMLMPLPAIPTKRLAAPSMEVAIARAAMKPGASAEAVVSTSVGSSLIDHSRTASGLAGTGEPHGGRSPTGPASSSADPWAACLSAAPGLGGDARVAATDAERLGLWASWLPGDVVRALTNPAEAIDLGSGGGAIARKLLIPLDDRMADAGLAGPGGQQSPQADGRMWRSCLDQMAQQASSEQVILALARRHELHAAVGTEPPGNLESRRAVRGVARMLGLTPPESVEP